MIHAATVDFRGRGVLIAGTGGAGKTSTVAKLIGIEGVRFMGDDWAFLGYDGRLLGYAKPMLIRPHHRGLYPHLFKPGAKRKVLIPSLAQRPMGRLATAVHPTIVRYPRAARFFRRWSPEHMMVTPQQAFPRRRVRDRGPARRRDLHRARRAGRTSPPSRWTRPGWPPGCWATSTTSCRATPATSSTRCAPPGWTRCTRSSPRRRRCSPTPSPASRPCSSASPPTLLADDASDALVAQVRDALGYAEVPA